MQHVVPRLFEGCTGPQVKRVIDRGRVLKLPPDTVLMERGDHDPALIAVLEGQVEVRLDGVILATLGVGDLVGEIAVFTKSPRTATVVSTTDCRLLMLERTDLNGLRAEENPVVSTLERLALLQLGQRLRECDKTLMRISKGRPSPYVRPPPSLLDKIADWFLGEDVEEQPALRPVNLIELMRCSRLFPVDAPDHVLEEIGSAFTHHAVLPGEFLCTQGEVGQTMFILAEGEVDVVVSLNTVNAGSTQRPSLPGEHNDLDASEPMIHSLATLHMGSMFGFASILDERVRMASCVARTRTDVLMMGRERWLSFIDGNRPIDSIFRRSMIVALAEQVRQASQDIASAQVNQDNARAKAVLDSAAHLTARE